MDWEATELMERDGITVGVRAKTPQGAVEIPANLTVGCDGRHAISRIAGHLPLVDDGVPIDILWFRIARQSSDPENALGYVNYGRFVILINRNDYFQVGYLIAKGSFPALQQQGLSTFRESLERIVPFLAGRTSEIDNWEKVKLLTIQVNHLERWFSPGLLCIGDAAHAMSPVGGIGINIALQDAVATANILAGSLRVSGLTVYDLEHVQHYREGVVRNTQRVQLFAHKILNRVLHDPSPIKAPLVLRVITGVPGFQQLTGRFIGMGLQPEHIAQA
jgi:2-polyprenyl-6-methoxyphenol hydroxylase-like FAD-dependent oxidoreductase